jgi:hypothetical protein
LGAIVFNIEAPQLGTEPVDGRRQEEKCEADG